MSSHRSRDAPTLPPVRACIFDVDGLLINSEDIYTDIYNAVLNSYGKPDLPWSVKAKQQSRGREGTEQLLAWAELPITNEKWTDLVRAQHHRFEACVLLPGVEQLLTTLTSVQSTSASAPFLAIASSASSTAFQRKTSHIPVLNSCIPPSRRVFGDDPAMSDARKKPAPDTFLLALERVNAGLGEGERKVEREECLVFEDSIAGVEAGRRAGMRVVWVPHEGLREVCRGREGWVLEGRGEEQGEWKVVITEVGAVWSSDGWAEMRESLQDFDFKVYGLQCGKEDAQTGSMAS